MNFCWLFGHTYSVRHPNVIWRDEFSVMSLGYYGICDACHARAMVYDESLPQVMPDGLSSSKPQPSSESTPARLSYSRPTSS